MIWHILRFWTSLLLPVFYKRIQGRNVKNIQVKGPVIIAMNHPNAFNDPVAFTMVCFPPRLKYLARGDAFKPGLAAWLLERLGIVPIFRIQDGGKEGLVKNDQSYRRVNELLKKNHKIIIFAEGLCVQERRLRPLKKGMARMVFGAYESLQNEKLVVVPVGLNYSWPSKFRSNLFYNVGEPIPVKDFIETYKANPARANTLFLEQLAPRMKELITHIDDPANDRAVYMLEQLSKKDMLKEQNLKHSDLEHQLTVQKQITALVNKAGAAGNPALNDFKTAGERYFLELQKLKLRDWLINPLQNKHVSYSFLFLRFLVLLAGCPIYVAGLLGNILPLLLTHRLAKRLIKKDEFYASIALGAGMFVFLFNYLIWFFITYAFSPDVLCPLLTCVGLILSGVFSLYYHPFLLKTSGMLRILRKPQVAAELLKQRQYLLSLINKF